MTRKVFLAMMEAAGFTGVHLVGTGDYRTSIHTQAAFYTARKPGGRPVIQFRSSHRGDL